MIVFTFFPYLSNSEEWREQTRILCFLMLLFFFTKRRITAQYPVLCPGVRQTRRNMEGGGRGREAAKEHTK